MCPVDVSLLIIYISNPKGLSSKTLLVWETVRDVAAEVHPYRVTGKDMDRVHFLPVCIYGQKLKSS